LFNFKREAKLEIRKSKSETRKSKFAICASKGALRILSFDKRTKLEYRITGVASWTSDYKFRVPNFDLRVSNSGKITYSFFLVATLLLSAAPLCAQVETIESHPTAVEWVSHGHVEGHLALKYSSDGAFSPDSSRLAVVADEKVLIMDLHTDSAPKALRLRLPAIESLEIHSANFLSPDRIFLLANGALHAKGKRVAATPLLAFEWNIQEDRLEGKENAVGPKGGYSPARYFPMIGYLALYKDGNFDLWNPRTNQGGSISLPDLTQIPNLYDFSPDGHWLLLGQIQTTSGADPSVVELKTHKFVDSLRGHEGTVLSLAFSRDTKKVVTACEDGKLRIFSVGDWKLLATLTGHQGAVHRAEFSPNGQWIASAGEDHTVRVWSTEDGTLLQTLRESQEPVLDVAFSPDSRFIAASSEDQVLIWQQK
jgi:WD40 repeat protein